MKTKVIYISGAEMFNVADVRQAFDTVRQELGLARDTILFGVPVDNDDALAGQFDAVNTIEKTEIDTATNISVDTDTPTTIPTPIIDDKNTEIIDTPDITENIKKPAKVKRTKKAVQTKSDTKNSDAPVIPILSVLSGDENDTPDVVKDADNDVALDDIDFSNIDIDDTSITDMDTIDTVETIDEDNENNTEKSTPTVDFDAADIDGDIPTVAARDTTITDLDDEEDGLEKLLQSVKSLHEDETMQKSEFKVVENNEDLDETDLTLEKLATEFAENQDKIVNTTKSTARGGRIGKLKNILPFKKAKSNESSLMGDLFGWAGVAANDEEFGIPEFFPTAAKK
ncbi:MAG: hypothetical protein IJU89_01940 [Alphaproteobacteria bacterium]|nr:hypothetical protein [Alphaproteobacteria bacterium]